MYQAGKRWYQKGCYQEALRYYFGAYEYFCAGDRLAPTARVLNSIGNLYRRLGDPEAALTFYNEALEIDRQLADTAGEAQTLINRSAALLDAGQPDRAAVVLKRATPLVKDIVRLALALHRSVGILYTRKGDLDAAETHLQKAMDAAASGGSKAPDGATALESAAAHYAMGRLRLAQEKPAEARPYFNRALGLDRQVGHTHGMADDLEALGDCARQLEAWSQASFYYQRSAKIFALLDHTDKTRQLLERLQALKADHPEEVNAELTLFFINRWVEGEQDAKICP
jgi:tetratricopeptide (TPR) repeat protein